MATNIQWYDASDVLLTTGPTISGIPGVPGGAATLKAINNKDGSDASTATNCRIIAAYAFPQGAQPKTAGNAWADGHYAEARIVDGWNLTPQPTDWIPLGANAHLTVPDLANDEGVEIEIRLNAAFQEAAGGTADIVLHLDSATSRIGGIGVSKVREDGIYGGLRDPLVSQVISTANVVEDPGGASANVQIQTTRWVSKGRPFSVFQQLVSVPATSADERFDALTLADDGTVTRTSGAEAVTPVQPTLPAGELLLAYIHVYTSGHGGVVDADIENAWEQGYFAYNGATNLNASIGPGPYALVDDSLVTLNGSTLLSLTASTTNYVWLLRNGTWQITETDQPPASKALLMHEFTTNGSGVTASVDRRHWIGDGVDRLNLVIGGGGEIVDDGSAYALTPPMRKSYILPWPNHVRLAMGTQAAGASSGSTSVDLERDVAGTFTSVLDASNLPAIAHDATDLVVEDVVCATYELAPDVRLRSRVETVPSGSSTEALDVLLSVIIAT
jgi:hypothetical protein